MGAILAARELALDREVAIKVLLPGSDAADARRRFVTESKTAAKLPHPGIPPVHALGDLPDGSPFLAMKLIRGHTLAELLARRPNPSADLSRFIGTFEQVCQAVGYAHSQGVIHRDLKPGNVMVGAFGEVQVMDWGLAKDVADRGAEAVAGDATRIGSGDATAAGTVMGTPAYMPPEQAGGRPVDARADVFALGGVLCAVLTGHPPYSGVLSEVMAKAEMGLLDDALARLGGCGADPELIGLCRRCLAADPTDRPADAGEVAGLVAAYRAGVEDRLREAEAERAAAEARAAEQRKKRRVQLALAAAVLVIAAGGGAAGWWLDRQRGEDVRRALAEQHRAEQSRATATDLLRRCATALGRDDTRAAADALAEAERRADEAGGDDALRAELAWCRADLDLLRALDRVDALRWDSARPELPGGVPGHLAGAFAAYGVGPGTPSAEAARRLAATPVRDRALAALDLWLRLSGPVELVGLLASADPDPFRDAVRAAVAARDPARVADVAGRAEALAQPGWFAAGLCANEVIPRPRRLQILLTAVRDRPADFSVLMALGKVYPENNPANAAAREKWYRAAVAARPASALVHGNLGIALRDGGDKAWAEVCFRTALRLDDRLATAHLNMGVIVRERGDLRGSIPHLERALELDPDVPWAHLNLGQTLMELGDVPGGLRHLQAAARRHPDDPWTLSDLGGALLRTGDLDGAEATLRKALDLRPGLAEAHNNLGGVYRLRKRWRPAAEEYRKAVAANPGLFVAHLNLGQVLTEIRDWDGAVASCRRAAEIDPVSAAAQFSLGLALARKGDVAGAVPHLREAARLDPKNAQVQYYLGAAAHVSKDFDTAVSHYREALRFDPKFAGTHASLGQALAQQGKPGEAVPHLREAARLDPNTAATRATLGTALREAGDLPGAEESFREMTRLAPADPWGHANLGGVRHQRGDRTGAESAYRTALRLAPQNAQFHRELGDVLLAGGDRAGARAEYLAAARLDPRRYGVLVLNLPAAVEVAPPPREVRR
jgi:tetratricopeptide (TPR) repeat protein